MGALVFLHLCMRQAGGASTPVASRWTSVPPPGWFSLPRHFQCYAAFCYLSMNVGGVAHRWGRSRGPGGSSCGSHLCLGQSFLPSTRLNAVVNQRHHQVKPSSRQLPPEQMPASRFTSSSSYCPALCCCFFLPLFSIFNIPNFIIISFFIILLLKKNVFVNILYTYFEVDVTSDFMWPVCILAVLKWWSQ